MVHHESVHLMTAARVLREKRLYMILCTSLISKMIDWLVGKVKHRGANTGRSGQSDL
jgi:hypothetical protein